MKKNKYNPLEKVYFLKEGTIYSGVITGVRITNSLSPHSYMSDEQKEEIVWGYSYTVSASNFETTLDEEILFKNSDDVLASLLSNIKETDEIPKRMYR
jgi:hypothetical protein